MIHNFPKQTFPFLHTQGNKIKSGLRIIVSFSPDGPSVMFDRIVGHLFCYFDVFIFIVFQCDLGSLGESVELLGQPYVFAPFPFRANT